jgi:hypothetical protein
VNGRPRPRRQASAAQQGITALLGPLDGVEIAGGCGSCDAYQTVEPVTVGVFKINVFHDPDCPELPQHAAGKGER